MIEINKIHHGDCLELMKLIPNNSIDMILCDLPYGTTQNKWDLVLDFDLLWLQYNRIIKKDCPIILTAQSPFDKILGASNIKNLKYEWIWHKSQSTGFLNAKKMPMKEHENILVFYTKLKTYNPILKDKPLKNIRPLKTDKPFTNNGNYGDFKAGNFREIAQDKSYPSSILYYENPQNGLHPTEKPVDLFRYLIKTYSNQGDIVLDNCCGSGTTAIAADLEKRDFICMELESRYFDIAVKRLKQHQSQTKLF